MGLLAKDNVKLRNLEITAWGELNTPTLKAESIYTKFMISYNVRCNNLGDQNAVSVAVRDAQEKHCGVVAMLRRIAPVDHEISIVSLE
jgi:putative redox protein